MNTIKSPLHLSTLSLHTLGLVTLGAVALGGCVVDSDGSFFGSGIDFGVDANWTVNQQIPSASVCADAGIETVRVVFWDAGTAVDVADLTSPCSAGAFSTNEIFAYGEYETQWQALDKSGNVLGIMGNRFDLFVNPDNHAKGINVRLAPIDFVGADTTVGSLSVSLGWQTPDMASENADCATAGVTTMQYSLTGQDGTVADSMTNIACGAAVDWAEIAEGTYALSVTGSDAAGNQYWTGNCSLNVTTGVNTATCTSLYTGPLPEPSIWMGFTFAGMNCASAGVDLFTYTVLDVASNNPVPGTQSQVAGACTDDTLAFDTGLTAGTQYVISVDAQNSTTGAKYGAACTATATLSPAAMVCNATAN